MQHLTNIVWTWKLASSVSRLRVEREITRKLPSLQARLESRKTSNKKAMVKQFSLAAKKRTWISVYIVMDRS